MLIDEAVVQDEKQELDEKVGNRLDALRERFERRREGEAR